MILAEFIDYLVSHVREGIPEIANMIVRQSLKPDSKPQFVLITISNGQHDRFTTQQTNFSVQILVQHDTDEAARQLAFKVYEFLAEDYDFDLAVPAGKTGNPVTVSQMKPDSIPSPLGNVGNGKYRYSTNYSILIGENDNGT